MKIKKRAYGFFKVIVFLPVILVLLFSCSTSDKVVSSRMFQKRKYTKGYFVNVSSHHNKTLHNKNIYGETDSHVDLSENDRKEKQFDLPESDLLNVQASADENFIPVTGKKKQNIIINTAKQKKIISLKKEKKQNRKQLKLKTSVKPKPDKQGYSAMAILGFILSFIALPSVFISVYLTLIFGIVGALFSLVGFLRTVLDNDKKGKFFAISGIIIGILAVFTILILIALATALGGITL